jgi:hypothetical protein
MTNHDAYGAVSFDGDQYWIEQSPRLTLPDSDWAFVCSVRFTSRTGTSTRDIFHWNDFGSETSLLFVRVGDASSGIAPNTVNAAFIDNDGTNVSFTAGGSPYAGNTSWTRLGVQRVGNTLHVMYNGSSIGSSTNSSFDALTVSEWQLFGNNIFWTAGFIGGLTDCAKWDRSLTTQEWASIASGISVDCIPGAQWFLPMIYDEVELAGGLEIDTDSPSPAAHPRMLSCR